MSYIRFSNYNSSATLKQCKIFYFCKEISYEKSIHQIYIRSDPVRFKRDRIEQNPAVQLRHCVFPHLVWKPVSDCSVSVPKGTPAYSDL